MIFDPDRAEFAQLAAAIFENRQQDPQPFLAETEAVESRHRAQILDGQRSFLIGPGIRRQAADRECLEETPPEHSTSMPDASAGGLESLQLRRQGRALQPQEIRGCLLVPFGTAQCLFEDSEFDGGDHTLEIETFVR